MSLSQRNIDELRSIRQGLAAGERAGEEHVVGIRREPQGHARGFTGGSTEALPTATTLAAATASPARSALSRACRRGLTRESLPDGRHFTGRRTLREVLIRGRAAFRLVDRELLLLRGAGHRRDIHADAWNVGAAEAAETSTPANAASHVQY